MLKSFASPMIASPQTAFIFCRNLLESYGIFNKKFRIKEFSHTKVAVPILSEQLSEIRKSAPMRDLNINFLESQMMMPFSKTHLIKLTSVQKILEDNIVDLFYAKTKRSLTADALKDLPKEWQIHGDMLLLPKDCMTISAWKFIVPEMWQIFCKVLNVSRIAKCERIHDDRYRSSKVELILGEDGWISRKENGIQYQYDVTKCMFSDGNITEKMRIASFDCNGMTVVDLFAGIGYFVLPYLVHAGASQVYACEWNPDAVEALKKNLELNKVSERCTVLEGDNKLVCKVTSLIYIYTYIFIDCIKSNGSLFIELEPGLCCKLFIFYFIIRVIQCSQHVQIHRPFSHLESLLQVWKNLCEQTTHRARKTVGD